MIDWFDEPMPHYRSFARMGSGVYDYMSHWSESVFRQMEKEFSEIYDSSFNRKDRNSFAKFSKNPKLLNKDVDPSLEEDENNDNEETPYYTCNSSIHTTSDGYQRIYREELDSKSGIRRTIETRRIGNKSLTIQKIFQKDGSCFEHEIRKNIKPDEIDQFNKQWSLRY
ncbi:cysteine protease, putative [Trichomonas vaginalis G3]|uniref:Cysteine protease, putative n=1 Tax=Trichomonas vaginalis (strain ATCC PRA-98 / G3) TaxID=412133 RepID=A2FG25_TRIV3|nr:myeloid leukemia factor family [Trichomonas vaginalis G3]EAX96144.1 cysteine protease, putative [Trichomonas vaginalis G3]KAI5507455.1 myeloid leukemia factor family [Trichomonas vaginalis G3]|eukprot:XP_001309074.1 cysteine protease [Trichomonas vaginalis G3]